MRKRAEIVSERRARQPVRMRLEDLPEIFGPRELAAYLGYCEWLIRREARKGNIPRLPLSKHHRFSRFAIEEWLRRGGLERLGAVVEGQP